jgi:predicted enzyme related to lactoylglutathione lyase
MTLSLRICIDVPEIEAGISFYTRALGLRVGRRFKQGWAELLGAPSPIDLLAQPAGTAPSSQSASVRDYARHWTPVHLDLVVTDLEAAVERAVAAGAKLEQEIKARVWGRIAVLADPFGHGLCLLEFRGRGYDALLDPHSPA